MTDPASQLQRAAEPDEEILAQFVSDWEQRGSAVLEEYIRRHPPLESELRALADMQRLLSAPRQPAGQPSTPKRLGEFFVLRRIGSGGMGDIYEAVQQKLNRRVAVKTMTSTRVDPRTRERFLREQRVLAKLHHTHIVPIHTAGEDGPLQYFAMPFIDGAPLHRVVRMVGELRDGQSGSNTPSLVALAGRLVNESATGDEARAAPPLATTLVVHPKVAGDGAPSTPPAIPAAASSAAEPAGPAEAPSDAVPTGPRTLSMEYFRSVAQVIADAAEALQHAHDVHVLHRDLKPSNIMVDTRGECWLIDFGLAGYLKAARSAAAPAANGTVADESSATGCVGTLNYMAPEQFDDRADVRTDVWGLGATLYELLTLHRAFPGAGANAVHQAIVAAEPTHPRKLVDNVPHDLAAICRKALARTPADRFQTAREFAADLRRWLAHEPTVARPARPLRRVLLWSRRNKGWAAAIVAVALAIVLLAIVENRRAQVAEANTAMITEKAKTEAEAAVAKDREHERDNLLSKQVSLRLMKPRVAGWSEMALDLVKDASVLRQADDLRDHAAAALAGFDARRVKVKALEEIGASSVIWSSDGRRLLLGGTSVKHGKPQSPAKIVDIETGAVRESPLSGDGAIAWRADGTALHAALIDPLTVKLCEINTGNLLGEFKGLPEGEVRAVDPEFPPLVALSQDGALLALAIGFGDGTGTLAVRDGATSKLLRKWELKSKFAPPRDSKYHITALAISGHGKLLATADNERSIHLWSASDDKPLAELPATGATRIRCLAFGRDPLVKEIAHSGAPGEEPLLLAAGNDGGQLAVWDLATRQSRVFRHRTLWEVSHVAFSQDGATLVSGGRQVVHVWDAATGDALLQIKADDTISGVGFAPDGRRVAVTAYNPRGSPVAPATVFVYELENGRGLQSLHGLNARVIQVRYSLDGRYIAALSVDWLVGIWQTSNGRLLHVLEAPMGSAGADNAGFTFSPDGRLFAFATAGAARLWDVESGALLRNWTLNRGFQEQLAFQGDKLLLFRAERKFPDSPAVDEPPKNPFVCRLYDLFGDEPGRPIAPDIEDFAYRVMKTAGAADGSFFVVDGCSAPENKERKLAAFDGLTGRKVWSIASEHTNPQSATIYIDSSSALVGAVIDDRTNEVRLFGAR
ncbi:MAG TPA: serine/threonine-protein kinase, partial [Pirellulales bacterium]|nr:serine/threonine-protein kinase [Pirellulales bacterium]